MLEKDRADLEIISFALGALANIFSDELDEEEVSIPADIGTDSWFSCMDHGTMIMLGNLKLFVSLFLTK